MALGCGAPSSTPESEPPAIETESGTAGEAVGTDRLLGPHDSIEAFCSSIPDRCTEEGAGWVGTLPGEGVFGGAALIAVEREAGDGRRELLCSVAVRTSDGWFVEGDAAPCGVFDECDTTVIKVEKLEWIADVGRTLLAVEYRDEIVTSCPDSTEEKTGKTYSFEPAVSEVRVLRICGMGSSGVPSCSDEIVIGGFDEVRGACPDLVWTIEDRRLVLSPGPGEDVVQPADSSGSDEPCLRADSYPFVMTVEYP